MKNQFFIRFRVLRIYHENMTPYEKMLSKVRRDGAGLHILSWENSIVQIFAIFFKKVLELFEV